MGLRNIEDLRAAAAAAGVSGSDEFLLQDYSKRTGIPVNQAADMLGFSTSATITGNRFGASIDNYQAGLLGVGESLASGLGATGLSDSLRRRREDNETLANIQSGRARGQGAVESFRDVDWTSPSSIGSFAGGLAIQSLPYAAESLVGGLAVRGAMTSTKAALGAARLAEDGAGIARAEGALARGATAGGVAASYPSAVGDILQNQREQADGQTNGGVAALLGVPYAAANAFGLEGALSRGKLFRNGVEALDDLRGVKGGLSRAGATGLGVGLQEGVSETGQEFINQFGRMAVDPNETFFNERSNERFLESFAGGAVLGGLGGAAGGGWRRSQGYQAPLSDTAPTDLLGGFNPGTSQGFEGVPQRPVDPAVNPLGDLTPEWGTSQGFEDLTRPAGVDGAGLYSAVDEPPLVPNGTGLTPSSEFSTGTQIPGVPFTPPTMVSDSFGTTGGTDAENALITDPGAVVARQQQLEAQARVQKVRDEVQARAAELQGLRARAEAFGLKGNKYVDLYGKLEQALDAGLITDAEMSENVALLLDKRGKAVEKYLEGKTATLAAIATNDAETKAKNLKALQPNAAETAGATASAAPAPGVATSATLGTQPTAATSVPAAQGGAAASGAASVPSAGAVKTPLKKGEVRKAEADEYADIPETPMSYQPEPGGPSIKLPNPRQTVRTLDKTVAKYETLLACLRS